VGQDRAGRQLCHRCCLLPLKSLKRLRRVVARQPAAVRVTIVLTTSDWGIMAQHVEVVDDLDGRAGAETVTFALAGEQYEIDLSSKNQDKLHKALAPFIASGRRVGNVAPITTRRGRRPRSSSSRADGGSAKAVRAWAASQGLEVSARGRIPAEIVERFQAAGN
jgi:hypothetical protein